MPIVKSNPRSTEMLEKINFPKLIEDELHRTGNKMRPLSLKLGMHVNFLQRQL